MPANCWRSRLPRGIRREGFKLTKHGQTLWLGADPLARRSRDRGVAVIANRPLGGGDLIRRQLGKPLPAWAAEIDCASWAQLLLKFVVSHPSITVAIPATSKVTHLRDNLRAGIGRMPDEAFRRRIAAECNS